jgi:hypothetical protein
VQQSSFTAEELENSFPMDVGRRFRQPEDCPLLTTVTEGMLATEQRKRSRTAQAKEKWIASIEVLLANLVAAHLNAIDRHRYVAVSFNRNDYIDTDLNLTAITQCKDYLLDRGFIDFAPGFRRLDASRIDNFGRRSRLRATSQMRQMMDETGINIRSLSRPVTKLIQLKKPADGVGLPPEDVEDSRALLATINARLATTDIRLDKAMLPILDAKRVEDEGEEADAKLRKRSYAGDLSAISLYRVFKYNWRSGGRIYGGWWMSLPRTVRPYLRINNSPVVELDYKTLHPLLLYQRVEAPMPDDPYVVDEWASLNMRELGKRTFNRLLNRKEPDPARRLKIKAAAGDKEILKKTPFKLYLSSFTYRLSAIKHWFGTAEGIKLQYEDSVLALRVLRSMEEQGIPVLPIHDSFIVAEEKEEQLRTAMEEAFQCYGIVPQIERKGPRAVER